MSYKNKFTSQISLDMQNGDSQQLLEFLNCRECHQLAQEAVETNCCHALLCSACLEKRGSQCPDCRTACGGRPNHLARRLVGAQPWRCPGCDKKTTQSEKGDHSLVCPNGERRCPADGCAFSGLPDAFLVHLTEAHKDQLLRRAECVFNLARDSRHCTSSGHMSDSSEDLDYSETLELHQDSLRSMAREFVDSRESMRGEVIADPSGIDRSRAQVEFTGKNYCQRPLNGPRCNCCNGMCGPRNGCNCVSCMRRDLVTFNVRTPLTLVNREGAVARISGDTGKFYCGRRVMTHDPETDGFCGPNNGHNCHACRKLDQQLHGRYAEIANQWEEAESRYGIDMIDG